MEKVVGPITSPYVIRKELARDGLTHLELGGESGFGLFTRQVPVMARIDLFRNSYPAVPSSHEIFHPHYRDHDENSRSGNVSRYLKRNY